MLASFAITASATGVPFTITTSQVPQAGIYLDGVYTDTMNNDCSINFTLPAGVDHSAIRAVRITVDSISDLDFPLALILQHPNGWWNQIETDAITEVGQVITVPFDGSAVANPPLVPDVDAPPQLLIIIRDFWNGISGTATVSVLDAAGNAIELTPTTGVWREVEDAPAAVEDDAPDADDADDIFFDDDMDDDGDAPARETRPAPRADDATGGDAVVTTGDTAAGGVENKDAVDAGVAGVAIMAGLAAIAAGGVVMARRRK